jgi:hypothetical protein
MRKRGCPGAGTAYSEFAKLFMSHIVRILFAQHKREYRVDDWIVIL